MIGEWIGPVLIYKRDGDQELIDGVAVRAKLGVVRIQNAFQIELIPVVVECVVRIPFVFVLYGVAEWIDRACEFPTEDLSPILRIGNGRWIVRRAEGRSVHTH